MTLCEQCSPAGIEQKSKYFGFGTCESCLAPCDDLAGYTLREILSELTMCQDSLENWCLIKDEPVVIGRLAVIKLAAARRAKSGTP